MRLEAKTKKALDNSKTLERTVVFPIAGTLAVEVNASFELAVPGNYTVTEVYLNCKTAPTGAAIIIDVNVAGVTIFTVQANRPEIAISATTGSTTTIDEPNLALNSILSVDIDQVGSTVAGADLTIEIRCSEKL